MSSWETPASLSLPVMSRYSSLSMRPSDLAALIMVATITSAPLSRSRCCSSVSGARRPTGTFPVLLPLFCRAFMAMAASRAMSPPPRAPVAALLPPPRREPRRALRPPTARVLLPPTAPPTWLSIWPNTPPPAELPALPPPRRPPRRSSMPKPWLVPDDGLLLSSAPKTFFIR